MNEKLLEIARRSQRIGKKHTQADKVGQNTLVLSFNQYSPETGEKIGAETVKVELPDLEKAIKKMEADLKALKALQKVIE